LFEKNQSSGCGSTAVGKSGNRTSPASGAQGRAWLGSRFSLFLFIFSALGCASGILKYDKVEELKHNKEFEQTVKIVLPPEPVVPTLMENATASSTTLGPSLAPKKAKEEKAAPAPAKAVKTGKAVKSEKKKDKESVAGASQRRQPELESDVGFNGRRPIQDPFRVGEKIVHEVSYFGMSAGTLILESRQFAQVNGRKNYQFRTSIKTSSLFSSFYAVDDTVDVLMDFEEFFPSVFTLHVKESGQLREAQMFFDAENLKATYWEKKVTKKDGEENKKIEWEILPYSQNLFSSVYYLRAFHWEVGMENAFRVADDNENLVFRGKAIRREKVKTAAGEFDAIVIKPEVELKGKFKPVGDNYIWLSDDDRRYILRIESKIRIGTLVSEAIEIHPGQ